MYGIATHPFKMKRGRGVSLKLDAVARDNPLIVAYCL